MGRISLHQGVIGGGSGDGITQVELDAAIANHALAGDPHAVYQKESEKTAPSGYASLDGTGVVPLTELPAAVDASNYVPRGSLLVNVEDPAYGATGSGADESAKIQAAINDVAYVGGGEVFLPHFYGIATALIVPSNVTLRGRGKKASGLVALAGLSTSYIVDVRGVDGQPRISDVTIRGLTFDCNNIPTIAAVKYRNTSHLLIQDCRFTNSPYYYVHEASSYLDGLTPLADHITLSRCEFDTHTGGSRECVIVAYVTDFLIDDCDFHDINLGVSIYRAAYHTTVRHSNFTRISGGTPNAIIYGRATADISIEDCTFTDDGVTSGTKAIGGCKSGDDYTLNGGTPPAPDFMTDLSIRDCVFDGFVIAYEVGAVRNFVDEHNIIKNGRGTGVLVTLGNTSANWNGSPSRQLSWHRSSFLNNMQGSGTAAVLFTPNGMAGVDLQAAFRDCTFDDTQNTPTQTRAIAFQGPGNYSGVYIDSTNRFNYPLDSAHQIAFLGSPPATGPSLVNLSAPDSYAGFGARQNPAHADHGHAFRKVQTKSNALSSAATSNAVTLDAAPTPGDLLVAIFSTRVLKAAVTPPAGWTLAKDVEQNGTHPSSLHVYYKIAGLAESATVTFTQTGSTKSCLEVQEWAGALQSSPLDIAQSTTVTTTAATATVPSASTAADPELLIAAIDMVDWVITWDGAWTNGFRQSAALATSSSNSHSLTTAYNLVDSYVGSYDTAETWSGGNGASNQILVSFKAALPALALNVVQGAGSPEGVVTKPVGWAYLRTDGGAATTLYVKESGSGNTGWVGK